MVRCRIQLAQTGDDVKYGKIIEIYIVSQEKQEQTAEIKKSGEAYLYDSVLF